MFFKKIAFLEGQNKQVTAFYLKKQHFQTLHYTTRLSDLVMKN